MHLLSRPLVSLFVLPIILALVPGCGSHGPELAPAGGRVSYKSRPLQFGTVTFQPTSGQPATSAIQSDGTFQLESRGFGAGATVGNNKVRIVCYESQAPDATSSADGELIVGKSLIPKKYTHYETSRLTREVKPEQDNFYEIELSD